MLYQIYETQRSIMEPFSDLAQAAAKLYSNPLNPMAQTPMAQRVSAGYALMHRLGKDYEKPAFGIQTVKVNQTDVAIHERIEIDKLLCDQGRVDTIRHEMMEASLLLTGIGFAEKYYQEPIVRCMEEIFFPAWKSFLKTIKWIDA